MSEGGDRAQQQDGIVQKIALSLIPIVHWMVIHVSSGNTFISTAQSRVNKVCMEWNVFLKHVLLGVSSLSPT